MKKSNKNVSLNYVAAALFFLNAILTFFSKDSIVMGIMWFSIGITFLSIASMESKKSKENDDNTDEKSTAGSDGSEKDGQGE